MKRLAALAFALIVLVSGCGKPPVGPIVSKDHHPARTDVILLPFYITTCAGNPIVCTQTFAGLLPHTIYYPERWDLIVQDTDGKNKTVHVKYTYWAGKLVGDTYQENSK